MQKLIVLLVFLFLIPAVATAAAPASCDGPHAILVNGGADDANDCDFYRDLDRANASLTAFTCKRILAADGPRGHSSQLRSLECDPGVGTAAPHAEARATVFKDEISAASRRPNEKPLLIYITDHGGLDQNGGRFFMGDDSVSTHDIQRLLDVLQARQPDRKIILIHDHCHSGALLEEIFKKDGLPRPNVCGLAAAQMNEYSYSGESIMSRLEGLLQSPRKSAESSITLGDLYRAAKFAPSKSTTLASSDVFLVRRGAQSKSADDRTRVSQLCEFDPNLLENVNTSIAPSLRVLLHERIEQFKTEIPALCRVYQDKFPDGKCDSLRQISEAAERVDKEWSDKDQADALLNDKDSSLIDQATRSLLGTERWKSFQTARDKAALLSDALYSESPNRNALCPKLPLACCQKPTQCSPGDLSGALEDVKAGAKAELDEVRDLQIRLKDEDKLRNIAARPDLSAEQKHALSAIQQNRQAKVNADQNLESYSEASRALRQLKFALEASQGLKRMMSSNDSTGLSRYLNQLSCEATPLWEAPR